jgi:hypothetical protein
MKKMGAPLKKDKKISYATKLPPYIVEFLREHLRPATLLIEEALVKVHEIKK